MRAKTRRRIKWAVLCLLVLVVAGGGLAVYLLQRPPAVWTQAQSVLEQQPPEVRAQIAEDFVRQLAELTSIASEDALAPLGDDPEPGLSGDDVEERAGDTSQPGQRTASADPSQRAVDKTLKMELTNRELVAVVSEKFAEWTRQRGYEVPDAMSTPVMMVKDGDLTMAFKVRTRGWSQVFSGKVGLSFQPDGMAVGRVEELMAGSLPVSIDDIAQTLRDKMPDSQSATARRIGEWVSQLEGFEFRPVLELEHRRRARVLAMDLGEERLTFHLRVQDHKTYKKHNALMQNGAVAVTDRLTPAAFDGSAFADVPATSD